MDISFSSFYNLAVVPVDTASSFHMVETPLMPGKEVLMGYSLSSTDWNLFHWVLGIKGARRGPRQDNGFPYDCKLIRSTVTFN